MPTALWWGRFDPEYSRNRILRGLLAELGWRVADFRPRFSALADWQAGLATLPRPDLVWVPCFRQRDLAAASRWARARDVPLLFDPLISAYDKQVDERAKLAADSPRARRLLARERALFRRADRVLADTTEHARYFRDSLGVAPERLGVVYVGAEEARFKPAPAPGPAGAVPPEVLFYGSFIPLQGAGVIVEAARLYQGPSVRWTMVGAGPELAGCRQAAAGLANVRFEPWVAYAALPARIQAADILLGVFGTTPKAGRVIPNKVFQALACGKPVVTRPSAAYPGALGEGADSGLVWVEAGNPAALAAAVAKLAARPGARVTLGEAAARTYQAHFSNGVIREQLRRVLDALG